MGVLINAYCTHREPPELAFEHELKGRRDRSDPELAPHLNGFAGFVQHKGGEEMTSTMFHVIQHILRVRHHVSLELEPPAYEAFAAWAAEANAICFMEDGTVRDPRGRALVFPTGHAAEEDAEIPYPPAARERKARTDRALHALGIEAALHLPPVIGEVEVELRAPDEVAARAVALFAVALRAESLASGEPIPVAEVHERLPEAAAALSPVERAFLDADPPEKQAIVDHAWRYEALYTLLWALGLADRLPLPKALCDVPWVARTVLDRDPEAFVSGASLQPTPALLDALDLHYRLHWACRQARLDGEAPPAGLDPGVIAERHHALNWLVRFEDVDWDEVDTPT